MTEYLFMGGELLLLASLSSRDGGFAHHCKCVLFVSPVSTTEGDKKKKQKEKETPETHIVLPIRLATLKVRLKRIKTFELLIYLITF